MTTQTWDERIAEAVRRSSWRLRLGVLALAVTIVASGIGVWTWWSGRVGELSAQHPRFTYGGVVMNKDLEFSLGLMHLEHPGKDVTVVSVEALTSPNVEYLGAFTIWPRDLPGDQFSVVPGFPPKYGTAPRHQLSEVVSATETAVIIPGYSDKPPGVSVVAGFRLLSGDIGAMNGIRVTYKVGTKTTREVFRYAAIACLPACKERKDWKPRNDFSERTLRSFNLLPDKA